ncbi:NERD domain-containing protein [Virgibacillus sp. MSP4-1]|uniref:nuclease-related domain-containing protein n=1 Tax=Virgibacillus sp. MSP4-1 TaxID=2700081 RepID=UPI0003A8753B|nr:nuclease-related domain-containing protein [Virgibacillus sp. MSP4-1]QHS22420.1 NERD domain-containing protein [Virgibacillus sp. MSP4-1]
MPFLKLFGKKEQIKSKKNDTNQKQIKQNKDQKRIASRKGELGEYKINIELDQLPKEFKYLSDIMIKNPRSKSGYSQIDHIILSPYGIFVLETKNYQGTIYGGRKRKTWSVNGNFKMMNPFYQNYGHIKALKNIIDPGFHNHFISLVSFTKRCTFKIEPELRKISSDELIIYDLELSEFINRKVRSLKRLHSEPILSEIDIKEIYETLSQENITDSSLRELHVQSLQSNKSPDKQYKCVICQKKVSEKVKNYCLMNDRFNGKVFCYEHQKQIKN